MSPTVLVDPATTERQPDSSAVLDLVASLARVEPAAMGARELQRTASVIRSVRCWLDALGAQVLTALATTAGGAAAVIETLADEGVSAAEIRRRRRVAAGCVLAPAFAAALASGRVTAEHVAALAKVRNRESVPAAADGLLAQAIGVAPEEFARRLTAWDDALDEANGISTAAIRHRKRGATFTTRADGMGVIHVVLPAVEHAIVHDAVMRTADELWRHSGDRESSPTQRFADALVTIAAGTVPPLAGAPSATADVSADSATADVSTAASGASTASRTPSVRTRAAGSKTVTPVPNRPPPGKSKLLVIVHERDLRGDLASAGLGRTADGDLVPIAEARRLACVSGILPVVLGGAGQALDLGRQRRLISPAQWHSLIATRPRCIIAGCAAGIHYLEAHHCHPWEDGGPSDLENYCLTCHTHHRLVHQLGWTLSPNGDGTYRCIAPDGTVIPTRVPVRTG